jgi:large repetitive protein
MGGLANNQTINTTPNWNNYLFTLTAGVLPTGIMLNANGTLSGRPTVFGDFDFIVRITDKNNCFGEQTYVLRIYEFVSLNPNTRP